MVFLKVAYTGLLDFTPVFKTNNKQKIIVSFLFYASCFTGKTILSYVLASQTLEQKIDF